MDILAAMLSYPARVTEVLKATPYYISGPVMWVISFALTVVMLELQQEVGIAIWGNREKYFREHNNARTIRDIILLSAVISLILTLLLLISPEPLYISYPLFLSLFNAICLIILLPIMAVLRVISRFTPFGIMGVTAAMAILFLIIYTVLR